MTQDRNQLTVIIPTLNRRQMLERAITSVEQQGLSRLNLIVVDQGSTDGTREFLEGRLLTWLLEEKRGAGFARNRGVEAADSQYVMFLDSDDWLAPGAISALVELIQREATDCAMGVISNVSLENQTNRVSPKAKIAPLASSTVLNRSVFERFGYFDGDNHSFPRWIIRARKMRLSESKTTRQVAFRGIHSANVSSRPGAHRELFDLVRVHRTLSEGD